MYSTKGAAMVGRLVDFLRDRFPKLPVGEIAYGKDRTPFIRVGTGKPGDQGFVIAISPIDWSVVPDAIGMPARVASPHVVVLISEAGLAGPATFINTPQTQYTAFGQAVMLGAPVLVYTVPNGKAPDVDAIVPAGFLFQFVPNYRDTLLASS